jgi:hypothetical protein
MAKAASSDLAAVALCSHEKSVKYTDFCETVDIYRAIAYTVKEYGRRPHLAEKEFSAPHMDSLHHHFRPNQTGQNFCVALCFTTWGLYLS